MNSISRKAKTQLKRVLDILLKTPDKTSANKSLSLEELEFIDVVALKYEAIHSINKEKAWLKFEQKLEATQKTTTTNLKHKVFPILKYAAILVGVSIALFFLLENKTLSDKPDLAGLDKSAESIRLNTFGGSSRVLNTSKKYTLLNPEGNIIAIQNGKEINYSTIVHDSEKENVMQELEVPNGQTFRIVLSDGTKVYCDAGTKIQFPVKFPENGERQVKLSGQAFFDVVSNASNPFVVNTKNVDVRVLGTQFNISAYDNSNTTQTVLAEGLVKLRLKDTANNNLKLISLVPGEMATYNQESKRTQIKTVNTYDYMAWMSQKLVFKEVSFSSILKTLERKFNITIINQNDKIAHEIFTAKFTNETLEQILNAFKANNEFTFRITDNQIIIQ